MDAISTIIDTLSVGRDSKNDGGRKVKAILVIDVPVLDDGRHLCNECPIWNKERMFCEYDFNMKAKGCPLKPMPEQKEVDYSKELDYADGYFAEGWNERLHRLEKKLARANRDGEEKQNESNISD